MSYRSLKRVIGETSLERKCRFLFGVCLLLLITASFWLYGTRTEKLVYEQNRKTGQLLADQVMLIRHWEALDSQQRDGESDQWTVDENAQQYLPLLQKLTRNLSKQQYRSRIILPDQTDEERGPRDEFERELLARFMKARPQESAASDGTTPEADGSEYNVPEPREFEERPLPDQSEYQYYQPIRARESCLLCHRMLGGAKSSALVLGGSQIVSPPPLAVGDMMAIVQVTIPNKPTQIALDKNRAFLITTAIITVSLAMLAAYAIVRYVIVKPLAHLREVSDAISHGNISLRAEIHTGDEFEALAVAFNRMLRHLVTIQEELRHVNVDLDGKVDELAQANMQLYDMNRIKSDFLATMSHELRTPLNSILGFSDVLGSIDSLDGKQKRYVENIRKSGRVLLEMINDILDLAKIESGKVDVRLTDFQIAQVIGAQCDMARPLTEKKNIDLETEVRPDLPPIHQDQARVQQILNNLLSNAIKFTPEGGRITVTAVRTEAEELLLRVADTGVGIAEEDLDSIFKKFRQGGNAQASGDAMTREYSGTGLGLSIVKELCKLLGGEITAESQLGKGSTFTVRLPWTLEEQPRLDSPVSEELEQFTKPRLDYVRHKSAEV